MPSLIAWNWPKSSGKEDFRFLQFIFAFSLLSPLGKGQGPSPEKNWIRIIQRCFVPTLVEIGPMVLEKKIFKSRWCIFAISLLFPLGNWQGMSIEQIWIPFTQVFFVPNLVEIGPVVMKQTKMRKVLRRLQRTINKLWSEKLTWAFSSCELKITPL